MWKRFMQIVLCVSLVILGFALGSFFMAGSNVKDMREMLDLVEKVGKQRDEALNLAARAIAGLEECNQVLEDRLPKNGYERTSVH